MRCILFLLAIEAATAAVSPTSKPCKKTLTQTKTVTYKPSPVIVTTSVTGALTYTSSVYRTTVTSTVTYGDHLTFVTPTTLVTSLTTSTSYKTVRTIPALAQSKFVPVQSSLPNSSFEYIKYQPYPPQHRNTLFTNDGVEDVVARNYSPQPSYCATKTVTTAISVSPQTITRTIKTYTGVTATSTFRLTTTTAYQYQTSYTQTSTSPTITTYKTKVVPGSSTSFYAACATNYFANDYLYEGYDAGLFTTEESTGFQDVYGQDPNSEFRINAPNPYECCVAALTKSNKQSSSWLYIHNPALENQNGPGGLFGDGTNCRVFLQPKDVCDALGQNATNWIYPIFSGVTPEYGFVGGNGYCGKYTDIDIIP